MKLQNLFVAAIALMLGGCFGPADIPDTDGAHLAGSIPHTEKGFVFGSNEWFIRTGPNPGGAGPNYWGSGKESVEVVDNKLHLRIAQVNGRWTSAEIMTPIPDGKRGAVITITSPTHDAPQPCPSCSTILHLVMVAAASLIRCPADPQHP